VRELQVLYDKYNHAYLNKRVSTQVQRDMIGEMIQEDAPRKFEQKWIDILDEVDQEMEGVAGFGNAPLLARYNNNYLSYVQKPYSLFQRRRRYKPMTVTTLNSNIRSGMLFTKVY